MRHLVLLFPLAACSGGDDTAPDDTAPDDTAALDDTGSDSGSDTASDTDPGTDAFPAATMPCLWRHGVHTAHTSWTYRWLSSQRIGTRAMSVFEFDAATQTATLKTTEGWTQTTGGVSFNGTTYDYVICNDDGLYLKKHKVNSTLVITVGGNTTDVTDTETTYSTPALVRPNELALNDTWTSHRVGTTVSAGAPDQSFDDTKTFTVIEDVVILPSADPAVNYGALKIDDGLYWQMGFGVIRDTTIYTLDKHTP